MYTVVGLGNPGEEHEDTRHNTGRMALEMFLKTKKLGFFEEDKKNNALSLFVKIGKNKVLFLLPQTFMNKSGKSVQKVVTSQKKAEKMIVVHDDIDLPLGSYKISFKKGSAGHKGVESVIKAVKTKDFWRIRIGITAQTSKGNLPAGKAGLKKPKGDKLLDFLMAKFKPAETKILHKVFKKITFDLENLLLAGLK